MTDDLVTRLRYQADTAKKNYPEVFRVSEDITYEAADRIEKLELIEKAYEQNQKTWSRNIARIEKLEAALREIIGTDELSFVPPTLRNVARKALDAK